MARNDEATAPRPLGIEPAVQVAKALAHPARLRILAMLGGGELCVCQLTAALGLAVSTVSGHLAELRRCGLVEEDKRGRWVHYRLGAADPLCRQLLARIAGDPLARRDADLAAQIRRLPPEALSGAGFDLGALGIAPQGSAP